MGKSRRNRSGHAHRKEPIAKQVKPPSDPELAALRQSKILPAIKDLETADPKSRTAAATAISNLVQDTKCRKLLLREQVVHTLLTQTLTDTALESRAAAWGILQVLAQEEEADFCVHLFRQDVLTAIEYAAKTICDKITSQEPAASSKAEQDYLASITASLVSLLTALAEAGDDILEAISANPALTRLLFVIVAHKSQGANDGLARLRSDALACLMMLCEDNTPFAGQITASAGHECLQTIMALKDEAGSDGVLACAALHNIFAALQGSKDASRVPHTDDSILIPALTRAVSTITPTTQPATDGTDWSSPVEQQQLALETLASIGTSLNSAMDGHAPQKEATSGIKDDQDMNDADDPGSDAEEGSAKDEDDHEMDQDEMEADMDMVTGAGGDDDHESIDDLPVLKSLLQTALPELVRVARFQPADDDSADLRSHALSALNNVAWSMSLIDFSDDHNAGIQKAWTPVGRSLWEQVISPILSTDTADVGLATQATGLAWAVSRSLGGKTPLKADEHRKFMTLYQATKGLGAQEAEDPFQSLGVKCVGVLGQLALAPAPVDRNREIGVFLVTLLAALPDTPAADAVEALNQVFDIYGDEACAHDREVFWKDNMLSHLEAVLPKARSMAKAIDKKTHAELRVRADEAVLNLGRFLAYKKKHGLQPVQERGR